jgi:hypothetical protein
MESGLMAKENQKDVIYYEALLKLWIDNRMILTKTFITISAGGIGILIAFSNNYKLETNFQAATFLFAIFFFILTIGCCIGMYHYNPPHLEKVLENINKNEEIKENKESKALKWLYRITILSLVLALLFAGLMTCFSVYNNIEKTRGKKMCKNNDSLPLSADGILKMRPKATRKATDNINGIKKMQPKEVKKTLKTNKAASSMSENEVSKNKKLSNKSGNNTSKVSPKYDNIKIQYHTAGISKMQPTKSIKSNQNNPKKK